MNPHLPQHTRAALPQLGANTLEHMTGGINTPFRERMAHGDGGESPILLRPAVILSVLLVAAAVALFLIPADLASRLPRFGFGSVDAASAPPAAPLARSALTPP